MGLFSKKEKLKDLRTGAQIELGRTALAKVQQGLSSYTPGETYRGRLTTDLSPLEQIGQKYALDYTNEDISGNEAFKTGRQHILDTLSGRFDPYGPEAESLRTSYARDEEKAIDVARRGQALRNAFHSTGALRQEGDIITDTRNRITGSLAELYSKERQNKLNAAGTAMDIGKYESEGPVRKATVAGQFGAVDRQNEIDNITNLYDEYKRARGEQGDSLATALDVSNSGQPLLGQTSVRRQTALGQIFSSLGGSITSAAAGAVGAKAGSALMSRFFRSPGGGAA